MFGWFKATLASLVHLLALYHHYSVIVELVLELYCETAKRILCYFTAAESKFFYENSLALIRTYAERQGGKRTVDKEAEEEQYRDLLLLMELLTNLLSKVWLYVLLKPIHLFSMVYGEVASFYFAASNKQD